MIYDLSAHPRYERATYGFLEIFDRVLELLLVSRDGVDQLCAPFLGRHCSVTERSSSTDSMAVSLNEAMAFRAALTVMTPPAAERKATMHRVTGSDSSSAVWR